MTLISTLLLRATAFHRPDSKPEGPIAGEASQRKAMYVATLVDTKNPRIRVKTLMRPMDSSLLRFSGRRPMCDLDLEDRASSSRASESPSLTVVEYGGGSDSDIEDRIDVNYFSDEMLINEGIKDEQPRAIHFWVHPKHLIIWSLSNTPTPSEIPSR